MNAGVGLYSVGQVLGHADLKSTGRYAHVSNDTLLAAVEAGAAKLGGAVALKHQTHPGRHVRPGTFPAPFFCPAPAPARVP